MEPQHPTTDQPAYVYNSCVQLILSCDPKSCMTILLYTTEVFLVTIVFIVRRLIF